MRVVGLDGADYKLRLTGHSAQREDCSSYHRQARDLLRELYPFDSVLEEVHLPGCEGGLYLDFFLPLRRLAVEVQGEQHYRFSPHFHGDRKGYLEAQRRDQNKREWCQKNNVRLVELPYHENRDRWSERIRQA